MVNSRVPILEINYRKCLRLENVDLIVVKQIFNNFLAVLTQKERTDFEQKLNESLRELSISLFVESISVDISIFTSHYAFPFEFDSRMLLDKFGIRDHSHGEDEIR